eukprot:274982_1
MASSNVTSLPHLLSSVQYHFTKRYTSKQSDGLSTALEQYLVLHQFDEWIDIASDLNEPYEHCCCKTALFNHLNITDIKEKGNVYKYLQHSIRTNPLTEIYANILTIFAARINTKVAHHILDAFKDIIHQKQWMHIADLMADTVKVEQSVIIDYIKRQTSANHHMVSTELQAIIMGQRHTLKRKPVHKRYTNKTHHFIDQLLSKMHSAFIHIFGDTIGDKIVDIFRDHIEEEEFDTIDCIKEDLEDVSNSALFDALFTRIHCLMSDESNYKQIIAQRINNITADLLGERRRFNIQNFVFTCPSMYSNDDVKENQSLLRHSRSVVIAQAVEQINDFPIIWWLVDAFSRDRVNEHKITSSHGPYTNGITLDHWWNDHSYCQFMEQRNSRLAIHMKGAVAEYIKRTLPSLHFRPFIYRSIPIMHDSLNDFVRYTLSFHTFMHQISTLMGCASDRYPCAPVQFTIMIVPRALQTTCYTNASPLNLFEQRNEIIRDPVLLRIQNHDCVQDVVQRDLCKQLLSIWNDEKRGWFKKRHQQYMCVIDRRSGNDTLHFMLSKKEHSSVSELQSNQFGMVDGTIHFCISYYLLAQNRAKSYVYFNYGGHKFDLSDMEWLWPRFFHKNNDTPQGISATIVKEIKACKMDCRLRDDDFDEFLKQNRDLTSTKSAHERSQVNRISQSIANHCLSMAINPKNIESLIMDYMHHHANNTTLPEIIEDLNHPNGKILNEIFDVIRDRLIDEHSIPMIKTNIQYDIQTMMTGRSGGGSDPKYFMITQFDLNVTPSEVDQAAKTMYTHCPIIFTHAESGEMAQDKCLCKAKAIDIKNGVPLTLWLLDMFCRDRIQRFKDNMLTPKYTIRDWWYNHNGFTRWIMRNYPNVHDEIRQALCCLVKRALPYLNLNASIGPVINDSLSDYVRYTLASHAMIQCIISNELNEVFPIQFDFWIIPQTVKAQRFHVPYDDDDETQNEDKDIIHSMSKVGQSSAIPQNSFWNLESYLKTSGYQRGKDYFMATPSNKETFIQLRHQLYTMWKNASGDKYRFRRYIFVIDRRNPINLQKQNMSYIEPNISAKPWNDTIYLIIPKERFMRHNKSHPKCDPSVNVAADTITKKFYELNECMLGESKKYLIPYAFNKGDGGTLNILDSVNGYKFALSYHLYQTNNCKCYWYIHGGGQYFELSDMQCLWPKFFSQINGKDQQIDSGLLALLKLHHNSQLQRLPNPKFYEFVKQTNHL